MKKTITFTIYIVGLLQLTPKASELDKDRG
jgi:hypothetical protein